MTLLLAAVFWLFIFPMLVFVGAIALIIVFNQPKPVAQPPVEVVQPIKPMKPATPWPAAEPELPDYISRWPHSRREAVSREHVVWQEEFRRRKKLARRAGGLQEVARPRR